MNIHPSIIFKDRVFGDWTAGVEGVTEPQFALKRRRSLPETKGAI